MLKILKYDIENTVITITLIIQYYDIYIYI